MPFAILAGLGAGLVSALLFASATAGTLISVLVLFALSPMPVAIAGLGWGWGSAGVAAITGAAAVWLMGSGLLGLAGIARRNQQGA